MNNTNNESDKQTNTNVIDHSIAMQDQPMRKTGLLRSGLLVSCMTMLSRILGLARDIVLAAVLGGVASGGQAGAFYIAFKVPQFLRRLFAEGAFSQAFVPVLSEYQQGKTKAEIKQLVDCVAGVLTLALLCVVIVVLLGSHWVTYLVAPGFVDEPSKFALTESLLRITFPYLLLISLAGFLGAILNTYNQFLAPAITPVWLNICLIAAGLYAANVSTSVPVILAYAVLLAGCIQFLFLMPFVFRLGLLPRPIIDWSHPGMRKILMLMLPALLGVSVAQINLVLDTILASFLPEGSIAWLYFSQRLSDLPLGVFAIAISTVILPGLSRQFASNHVEKFAPTLDWGVRFVLMIAIPATIGLVLLAEPILSTLFLYGKTTLLDITMSAYSLAAYSLGIVFFMLIKVLVPGFYARQDMKTPVKIAVIAMLANIVLNILLVIPLHHYFKLGHIGLALATSLSAMINVALLLRYLIKHNVYQVQAGFWQQCITFLIAGCAMAVVIWVILLQLPVWSEQIIAWRITALFGICCTGALVYFLVLRIFGVRLRDFRQNIE